MIYSKPEVRTAWVCAFESIANIITPYEVSPIVYAIVLTNSQMRSKEFRMMTYIDRATQLARIRTQDDYTKAFDYKFPNKPEYKKSITCDTLTYQQKKKRNKKLSESDDALLRLRCLYQMIDHENEDLYYNADEDKIVIIKGVDFKW